MKIKNKININEFIHKSNRYDKIFNQFYFKKMENKLNYSNAALIFKKLYLLLIILI